MTDRTDRTAADPFAPGGPLPLARPVTRRALLAGGAGAVLLAACGSSGSGANDRSASFSGGPSMLAFFDAAGDTGGFLVTGSPQRAPFGLAAADGSLLEDSPTTLDVTVTYPDSSQHRVRVARHNKALPRAYYPLVLTPPATGNYHVSTRLDGVDVGAAFSVFEPSRDPAPRPGSAMPKLVTPTVAAPHGVDPICTRDPICPLHGTSLHTALAAGTPVAYLVATPKFCQVAICGPVLDVLLGVRQRYAGRLTMIHQEVYANAKEAAEKGNAAELAPALTSLKLGFEPVLFLIDAKGTIRRRIDFVFDEAELVPALDALVG